MHFITASPALPPVIDPAERGHLFGDVPALLLVAIVLAFLTPRKVVSSVIDGGTAPKLNLE
ncbi:hypothetical protein FNW02_35505 [Komarekiella sp. 'clone 1']|uniref:Uncharacterized protein n=1 Tax=Komarekiella delphini-convector SJRDD-AB1 TaxID=2593771 RepID=A0AA40T4R3_9NOST|nr:hypothetical protein [Komarekiella delphini-convector]MBD6620899.1 hypothetical protein [Komarekiella delphini-convector SJRDD-AB1]